MSVTYSQIWTVEDFDELAMGTTDLSDLIIRNIIKEDALANFIWTTVGGGVALGIIEKIKKYVYINPELFAMKIIRFIKNRSVHYVVASAIVLYLTREGFRAAADWLRKEVYAGFTITVEFALPASLDDIVDIADVRFTPF